MALSPAATQVRVKHSQARVNWQGVAGAASPGVT